jgi:predicted aspartyl protease
MGTLHVKFTVRNPADPGRSLQLEGLVDTGTHFTQIPLVLLEQIGITPFESRQVQYATGVVETKPVASAEILLGDRRTPTVVLCGDPDSLILIGAFTLEGLNLGVDPLRKTLITLIPPQA